MSSEKGSETQGSTLIGPAYTIALLYRSEEHRLKRTSSFVLDTYLQRKATSALKASNSFSEVI